LPSVIHRNFSDTRHKNCMSGGNGFLRHCFVGQKQEPNERRRPKLCQRFHVLASSYANDKIEAVFADDM